LNKEVDRTLLHSPLTMIYVLSLNSAGPWLFEPKKTKSVI